MLYPSKEEVKNLLSSYKTVPVFYEMLIDSCTPVGLFAVLKEKYENCFILESVDNSEQWGRYSFIGIDPKMEVRIYGSEAEIIENGVSEKKNCENPIELFNEILSKRTSPVFINRPKLTGGLIGYFGYDTVRRFEKKLVNVPEDDLKMPDSNMFLYDEIVAYDHLTNKAVIILNINAGENVDAKYEECIEKSIEIGKILSESKPAFRSEGGKKEVKVTSNVTKEEFIGMVETAKQHIVDGDISQVVLSQRFEVDDPP
ncbi:MAG: anthranilate synthase component I, partial [Oscillospiraceae bacterium]